MSVSDEEVRRAYDEKKQSLQSPERRSLRYVSFVLSEKDAEKKGKERIAVLQKIAEKTNAFAQALADSGRNMAAFGESKKVDVHATPFFDAKGLPDGKLFDHDSMSFARQGCAFVAVQGRNYNLNRRKGTRS